MKTKIILFALLLTVMSANAQKRHKSRSKGPEFKNAVRVDVLPSLVSQYQLTYERALNNRFSAGLSAGYISRSSSIEIDGVTISKSTTTGIVLIPEAKFYFKETFDGWYTGAYFRYKNLNSKYPALDEKVPDWSYKVNRSTISGGVVIGYHYAIFDRISMDYFIGPHFKSVSTKKTFDKAGVTDEDVPVYDVSFFDNLFAEKSGVGVRVGFNIGFVF